jgi:hypothetical protein
VGPAYDRRRPRWTSLAIGRAWGVGAKASVGRGRNAGLVVLLVPRRPDDPIQAIFATGQLEGLHRRYGGPGPI